MSISEKLVNAQATEWLSEGLEEKEIKEIKELALIAARIEGKRNTTLNDICGKLELIFESTIREEV